MSHIAPHTLSVIGRDAHSADAGQRSHLQGCAECQRLLAKIRQAHQGMDDIAVQGAPELGWDHIATRVYWSTSSERRSQARAARPRWIVPVMGSVGAVAMAGIAMWAWPSSTGTHDVARSQAVQVGALAEQEGELGHSDSRQLDSSQQDAGEALEGALSYVQGEVTIDGHELDFDSLIGVGAVVRTGLGRAVVQFGEQSAFRVAAQSQLRIARFDSRRVELHIDGVVDVDITRRLPGQEFVVVAGGHEVVVHGTAFRVEYREGEIAVSCTRGEVVVTDGKDMVHVPAGQAFRVLSAAWEEAALRSLPLDGPALRALDKAMRMPMLPTWNESQPLRDYGSVIEVKASASQMIAVDGVAVSTGTFMLRSPSGRHQLAIVDDEGVLGETQWLELAEGQRGQAKLAAQAAPTRNPEAVSLRKAQLHERLGKRAEACLKPLAKKGLAKGSYAIFDVGVNADGSQGYLNVIDSNLSPMIQRCFRDAIDLAELPAGPEASFRLKLQY